MWLKTDTLMPNHPKVIKLAAKLGKSRRETVGLLLDFFVWVRSYAETGFLSEWANEDICLALGLEGVDFVAALQETKWIKDGWIKNWHVFGGAEVAEKAKRDPDKYHEMIEFYEIIPYGENTVKIPKKTRLEKKRKEEKRKEKPNTAASAEFETFWKLYPFRKGRKVGQPEALSQWNKLNPTGELLTAIMAGVELIKNDDFPMDAHRWLAKKRWIIEKEDQKQAPEKLPPWEQKKIDDGKAELEAAERRRIQTADYLDQTFKRGKYAETKEKAQ